MGSVRANANTKSLLLLTITGQTTFSLRSNRQSTPLHLVAARVKTHQTATRCNDHLRRCYLSVTSQIVWYTECPTEKQTCATFENESTTFERRAQGLFTLRFSMVSKEQTPTQRDNTIIGHTLSLGIHHYTPICWVKGKEPLSVRLNGSLCAGKTRSRAVTQRNLKGIYCTSLFNQSELVHCRSIDSKPLNDSSIFHVCFTSKTETGICHVKYLGDT